MLVSESSGIWRADSNACEWDWFQLQTPVPSDLGQPDSSSGENTRQCSRWDIRLAPGADGEANTGDRNDLVAGLRVHRDRNDRAEAVVSRLACSRVAKALCCRIGPAWAKRG